MGSQAWTATVGIETMCKRVCDAQSRINLCSVNDRRFAHGLPSIYQDLFM